MSRRPQRSTTQRAQYQPPSIDRPSRRAKTVASGKLVERSSSPIQDSERKDSFSTKGKHNRKRDEDGESSEGFSEGAESEDEGSEEGSEGNGDEGVGGMKVDNISEEIVVKPKGEVDGDVDMEEEDDESESESESVATSEASTIILPTRKIPGTLGANPKGMVRERPTRATIQQAIPVPAEKAPLKINDGGPKMELGEYPRFYAKIIRRKGSEEWDPDYGFASSKPEEEDFRLPNHKPIILPRVDLSILQCDLCTHQFSGVDLVRFAMSGRVLPLLKMWGCMWLNPDEKSEAFHEKMLAAFPSAQKPWNPQVDLIAKFAAQNAEFAIESAEVLYGAASLARKLVTTNEIANDFTFFLKFSQKDRATDEPYKFAVRLLLAVWADVEKNENGFFTTLFRQECGLSQPLRPEVRQLYEGWYMLDERMYQKRATGSASESDYHGHESQKLSKENISVMKKVDQQAFQECRRAAQAKRLLREMDKTIVCRSELQESQLLSEREVIEALKALQPEPHAI